MEFRVLGPLLVYAHGRELEIPAAKQRVLLAGLLLRANRVVPIEELMRLVWGDDLPRDARGTVQTYIGRLRRTLGDGLIHTRPAGYLIAVADEHLDLARFERLLTHAGQAADARAEAALLAEALSLWLGPPLAGVPSEVLQRDYLPALVERRLRALERRIDLDLRAGRHADLVAELRALTGEHPLREGFWAQLMRALAGCGRQSEALRVYDDLRVQLADELGIDPSPWLCDLHRAILRGELPAAGPTAAPVTLPAPAQLPADVPGFTGRRSQLDALDAALSDGGAVRIVAIEGSAGVGKTALAVRWAHRVRDRFPDGQLYVNLRGWDPGPPVRPAEALAGLLAALGVPADQQPADLAQASAAYRTLLADRRALVLLDNAASAEQVRPLLPGGSGCTVLVTSRNRLAGLVARDGARPLPLAVLTAAEATALLAAVLGTDRFAADPAAAADLAELVELCGRLPLALRVAAANLLTEPQLRIVEYVRQLRGTDRLAALAVTDDPEAAVSAAFDLSYHRLPAAARRMFRVLALPTGPDLTTEAAAVLIDAAPGEAERLLGTLARAYLVDRPAVGRYALHDLLRRYAADRSEREDSEPDRRAALDRLYGHYLQRADAAARLLYPNALRLPGKPEGGPGPGWTVTSHDEALAWLDAERSNLVATVRHAAAHGPHQITWLLADAMRMYFFTSSSTLVDGLAVAEAALAAAEAAGDRQAAAMAHLGAACLYHRQGNLSCALDHYNRAHAMTRDAGWLPGRAAACNNLGILSMTLGRLAEAADRFTESLVLDRQIQPGRTGAALTNLGIVLLAMGRLEAAADHARRGLSDSVRVADRNGAAINQTTLAGVAHARGGLELARRRFTEAMVRFREIGNRFGESDTIRGLAAVHRDAGRSRRAYRLARAAARLANQAGNDRIEASCLATLGTVSPTPDEALDAYRRAIELANAARDPAPQARALIGLAETHRRRGELGLARSRLDRALALAHESGFRLLEARALTALAELARDRGEVDRAIELAEQALAIGRETGHRIGEARTRLVLGDALCDRGRPEVAAVHWRHADRLFTEIGLAPAPANTAPV